VQNSTRAGSERRRSAFIGSFAAELSQQPRLGDPPVTSHGIGRHLQCDGRLVHAEASEEPKLHHAALALVHPREGLEGIVDGHQIVSILVCHRQSFIEGHADPVAAALLAPDARVRGLSPRVVAVINEAAAESETFRGLVDRIGATDGIVYVADGKCGHGVRACLLITMTMMGPNRVLRILVDPGKDDREFMASVGHELQHAFEVLSNRTLRTDTAMVMLFHKSGTDLDRFETYAANEAGRAVRAGLRATAAAERRK
jgi:hypothetical protein